MEVLLQKRRQHPSRKCPFCQESFYPKDARQLYCCRQHQTYFNNDLRKERQAVFKSFYQKLKNNRDILLKAWLRLKELNQPYATLEILQYEAYDFSVYETQQINMTTNQPVFWVMGLGIEAVKGTTDKFYIHLNQS